MTGPFFPIFFKGTIYFLFFIFKVKKEDTARSSHHYESEGMENYEGFIENYGKYFVELINIQFGNKNKC